MTSKSQAPNTNGPKPTHSLNAMEQLQAAGFGNIMGTSTAWMDAFGNITAELIDFVGERIREDVKAQSEILQCKSPSDLQQIQAQFMQKTLEHYEAETGKLVEIGTKAFGLKSGTDKT
jgi:hypothetical protein